MMRSIILLAGLLCMVRAAKNYIDIEMCIDGKHQKFPPGPLNALHGQCSAWKEKACCSSLDVHSNKSYLNNFNWDHCSIMSPECKKHFIKDTCFYECSPNLGPWIQAADSSWRKQRILDVPLCKEDCESWYGDCKMDYTCMENWHVGWNWSSEKNVCPPGKMCRRFSEIYPTAKDFCEKVWSNSYKYTAYGRDSGRCMQLSFPAGSENPNVRVAKYYADLLNSAEPTPARDCYFSCHQSSCCGGNKILLWS